MKAAATVLCNNILARGRKEKIKISPMKLQKLMYYVCCGYVQQTGELPISELFEVWQYGPVLPSVYEEFKAFHANPIKCYATDAQGTAHIVSERDNPILHSVLCSVWEKHKMKSGIELSKMTHQPNSGWYIAYQEGRENISLEDMKNDKTG